MPTATPSAYALLDPKRRQANKQIAQRVLTAVFDGKPIDALTSELPEWGTVHIAAYTDLDAAMICAANEAAEFGSTEWHSKGRIAMLREIPVKGRSPARCAVYICKIEDLFDHISVGRAGVKWADVSKVAEHRYICHSADLMECKEEAA